MVTSTPTRHLRHYFNDKYAQTLNAEIQESFSITYEQGNDDNKHWVRLKWKLAIYDVKTNNEIASQLSESMVMKDPKEDIGREILMIHLINEEDIVLEYFTSNMKGIFKQDNYTRFDKNEVTQNVMMAFQRIV